MTTVAVTNNVIKTAKVTKLTLHGNGTSREYTAGNIEIAISICHSNLVRVAYYLYFNKWGRHSLRKKTWGRPMQKVGNRCNSGLDRD